MPRHPVIPRPLKLGVYGMWWSMVLGTGMATMALAVLLYRVDWAPGHQPGVETPGWVM